MEKNRYGHILTENFQEAVGAWIKNYSNNIAIIEGERKITYRELGNLIIRCRKFFFEQGVKKGDNIAVHMGNHSEFIMVFLSLVTMGAVPILILSAQKKNEVRGIVRVATPKLYIYDAAVSVLGSLVAEGNKELKGIEKTIFTSMLESSEVEKTKEETYKEQIVPEDLALLLLSGGTTGIPKLIPRTHGDYLYNVKRITERLKLTQESVFLSVLPMAHNFALGNPGILGTLCSGGTVVICNDIAAMEIFSLIEETKVTFTAFVPSILKMCLEYRILDDGDDISSLQQVLVGGAMLPEETARQVDLVLGGKLIQVFGTAEGLICTNSMDDSSSDVLPELMAGKEDPLNLLFPKGEMDVAMAAYHDNIINRIMNGLAKEEIEFLALDNRRTPIRILEVGAGVGGTSVDVIPSLDGTGAEYYFTDLSAFFLNNAREKFSGYEWVKYNIFDINKDIMEQTIAPFSVDIILAANVLHNAKNIHYVLENLKKLLKPNGTIIILEETLEAYTLLTSMEFKDGLTGFTDERAENNQTFFKREQWEGVFKEHKADIVYQFPEKGTPLEMAGQTIYVVRFKENYICPDKNNMLDELERRIPEYMIPSVITFLPRLPQTSNDKIDRGRISKWISASAEENKKVDVAELPQNDLEEQIARIWCKELNIERIGRNDNFYLSGGDSLLIAQVIARMRETIEAAKRWSWDDLLKEMMKTPTIRGVAKILSNQAGENEQDKSLVIIKEAAESSEKKVTVVFHAGTGTLTPYNSLIAYITERSQENEAVMGFTFGDEAEYLAIPTDKIFENLGKKYGRILSELGFTEYTLIGHCVGGLIALETAHYLKDKGKNVSSVTLLSTSIPHKKEETVLADLDMKIFETAVQTSLYNELLLERTFASLIDADIKKAGHQVDNDTLQQVIEYLIFNNGGNITVQALCSLTGKFAEVGAEFQRLHSMSATERMNDLYTTIERPNGQLMEHQRKMLNVLFRVFAQNFRCVSSYIPKVYTGKMRVFDCESAIANFFPSLFSEDKKTWEQYAQGEFLFDTMKGDHISCMNSPYIEENVKKILDL